jgi:hypothetical protein
MKTFAMTAIGAALFGSALLLPIPTYAQSAATPGIPGYLDPTTGVFKPVVSSLPTAATLTRTGKVVVTVTVQIDSSIPADQQITCSVSIGSSDFPGISNGASSESGVIRSGSSGKCTTTIPYVWIVASAATKMSVSVSVSTGEFTFGSVSHSASTSFPAFSVPTGTKSLSVKVAL